MRGLTLQRLYEVLKYDPETGEFSNQVSRGRGGAKGSPAGSFKGGRYVTIQVDKIEFYAHRLAWFYMTGEEPDVVDHKNHDKKDNRWDNLQNVSKAGNEQNRVGRGVRKNKAGRWSARLKTGTKETYLGTFDTEEEARMAYIEGKKKHHPGYAGAVQ